MKRMFFLTVMLTLIALGVNAQTKKDDIPDMRYKAIKEMYGNSYSVPSYSTPSYSQPKQERNYAQTKKDGTSDMRYKANKEMYGNSYSTTPSYSRPSYSTPSYSTPSY
ncbi:hypothetical protein [Solitalea lacus]|uniref:hypothetical protein n=1 Tax=Solitalea lacus TaxID=2911172 RepID=UPI001EDB506A|nr:hypothetical protein [Solitalea lacus]UKJ09194.1 hypothetical protein L2B55_08560 [Solitalea lacus]